MPRAALALVVPTRDRPELLARCLASLSAQLRPGDEAVVVDSASTRAGEVAAVVAAAGVRLVRCEQPGASRARNAGWRATSAPFVAFVDDDMELRPGWAEQLLAAAAAPGVGFAAGRTVADTPTSAEPASVTWGRPAPEITLHTRGVVAASNNLLLRREALLATGGFDERLGPGTWLEAGEDLELLDRVLGAGYSGRYVDAAVGCHVQWRDARSRRRLQWAYGKGMGARLGALTRRDRRRAWRLAPELLRLAGLATALRRLTRRPGPAPDASDEPPTSGGPGPAVALTAPDAAVTATDPDWVGPVLWRLGALVGLAVGWATLDTAGGPSGAQVAVLDGQPAYRRPSA